jgi:uncharacterized membrane protein SirB2
VYATVKLIHIGAVALSAAGFVVRFVMFASAPHRVRSTFVRIAPHVVDSVLLASAIALALLIRANPLTLPWLSAKLIALVLYIVAGNVALGAGRSFAVRCGAFFAALSIYAYIVAVAITRNPWPIAGLPQ